MASLINHLNFHGFLESLIGFVRASSHASVITSCSYCFFSHTGLPWVPPDSTLLCVSLQLVPLCSPGRQALHELPITTFMISSSTLMIPMKFHDQSIPTYVSIPRDTYTYHFKLGSLLCTLKQYCGWIFHYTLYGLWN